MKHINQTVSQAAKQLGQRSWQARKTTQYTDYFRRLAKKAAAARWHTQSPPTPENNLAASPAVLLLLEQVDRLRGDLGGGLAGELTSAITQAASAAGIVLSARSSPGRQGQGPPNPRLTAVKLHRMVKGATVLPLESRGHGTRTGSPLRARRARRLGS
jgi:hypothetical protein